MKQDGSMWAAGANNFGQLGIDSQTNFKPYFEEVFLGSPFKSLVRDVGKVEKNSPFNPSNFQRPVLGCIDANVTGQKRFGTVQTLY